MDTMIVNTKNEWILTNMDRCDKCNAQALVLVKGVSGELLFCGHHYNNIMNDTTGYDAMMKFAYEIVDEREKISQNRSKGESY